MSSERNGSHVTSSEGNFTHAVIKFFAQFSFVLSQKRQFFADFFGKNVLKIVTSAPEACFLKLAWAPTRARREFATTQRWHQHQFRAYLRRQLFRRRKNPF
jgi:hypothetical protein